MSNMVRRFALVLLGLVAAWFVWAKRGELPTTRDAVTGASPLWLGVAVVLGVAFMVNQAMFYAAGTRGSPSGSGRVERIERRILHQHDCQVRRARRCRVVHIGDETARVVA